MNRAERRKFAKKVNTPQKLEAVEDELRRKLREEYEAEYHRRVGKFIRDYSVLLTYVIDYELEKEENIRVVGRKTKNMQSKISKAVVKLTDSLVDHLELVRKGEISIDDIEKYLKEERDIEWKWH